ncbi:MAG: twin-arginine translocase TatA/TatE family subunit [Deltaproteobacteria bacterium]|nr:twin-arginine translocase TatA/TatE family subunit [Deltaproteobacteria bacterium]
MLGVGLPEFILIAIAALIIIGPERMPEIAKAAAKAYVQLRKAGDELTKTVREIDPGPLLNERKSYASKGAAAPVETAPTAGPEPAPKPADTDDGAKGTS